MRELVKRMQRYVDGELDAEQLATAVRRAFAQGRAVPSAVPTQAAAHAGPPVNVSQPTPEHKGSADTKPAPANTPAEPKTASTPQIAAPKAPTPQSVPTPQSAPSPQSAPIPQGAPSPPSPARQDSAIRRLAREAHHEERAEILRLFLKRNLRAGDYYPLPEFRRDFNLERDPDRTEAKLTAFRELAKEGLFVEAGTVLQLTEKGFAALKAMQ